MRSKIMDKEVQTDDSAWVYNLFINKADGSQVRLTVKNVYENIDITTGLNFDEMKNTLL